MIKAEIVGINRATALGVEAFANAPVLTLCRKLVEAGHDPAEPLEAFRGDVLCLRVSSIGEGAKWTVKENETLGPRFVIFEPLTQEARHRVRHGSPVRSNGVAASQIPEKV